MSNSVPEKPDLDTDPEMSSEQKVEKLSEHYQALASQNKKMKKKLMKKRREKNDLQEKMERLSLENEVLQSASLYIATVQEIIESGERAPGMIIQQHGNNREVMTEADEALLQRAEVGDRVTIDDSFSVQGVLDSGSDERAQAMEVTRSPNVSYADIGGLDDELNELREVVERPLEASDAFSEVGIDPPQGVLLHGPPGTGKTMMAKAVASEVDATFIKLAGSELVRKFIGEGARLVRDLFTLAEEEAPAVIFIDEIDAIASKRTVGKTSGDQEVQRTLMQLLSSMDGFEDRGDIRIIGATNRFDMLDDAILRPGRFDRQIYVGEPTVEAREEIFAIHSRDMAVDSSVDFKALADKTDGFTGADIEHVVTEAGMFAIREEREKVTTEDFDYAVDRVREEVDAEENKTVKYAY